MLEHDLDWLLDGVFIGCLYLLHLCTQQVTKSNTALSLICTLYEYSSPLHTHQCPQFSLVVSRAQVLLSQPSLQNSLSTDNSTNWVPGLRPFHTSLLVFSSQAGLQLNSLTHQPAASRHFTQLSWWQLQLRNSTEPAYNISARAT
jgi:hypothetical protein